MIDLSTYVNALKSILCLNGEIPSADFFMRKPELPLIAADGAGHALINMGIIPDLIVGDLDSIDRSVVPTHTEIICITEQNSTDFEKCLRIIEARNLFPCLVYGATGKESDHALYNFKIMADYALRHTIIFHDSAYKAKEKYGVFVSDHLVGSLKIGAKLSLLAFAPAIVSTKGLAWDLDQMTLSPHVSSTRNAVQSNPVEITVHSGSALVLFDS